MLQTKVYTCLKERMDGLITDSVLAELSIFFTVVKSIFSLSTF